MRCLRSTYTTVDISPSIYMANVNNRSIVSTIYSLIPRIANDVAHSAALNRDASSARKRAGQLRPEILRVCESSDRRQLLAADRSIGEGHYAQDADRARPRQSGARLETSI